MGVTVLLAFDEAVSVADLEQFLSYVPADTDPRSDLRMMFEGRKAINYLAIRVPAPVEQAAGHPD